MWTSRLYLRLWTSPSTSSLWKATDNSWLTTSFQKMGTHPCISSTTHLITIFSTLGHNYDQRNCSNQEYWLRLNKFQLCLKTLTKLDFYKILQFTGIHHLGMSICCTMCTKHLETLKCCLLFFNPFYKLCHLKFFNKPLKQVILPSASVFSAVDGYSSLVSSVLKPWLGHSPSQQGAFGAGGAFPFE